MYIDKNIVHSAVIQNWNCEYKEDTEGTICDYSPETDFYNDPNNHSLLNGVAFLNLHTTDVLKIKNGMERCCTIPIPYTDGLRTGVSYNKCRHTGCKKERCQDSRTYKEITELEQHYRKGLKIEIIEEYDYPKTFEECNNFAEKLDYYKKNRDKFGIGHIMVTYRKVVKITPYQDQDYEHTWEDNKRQLIDICYHYNFLNASEDICLYMEIKNKGKHRLIPRGMKEKRDITIQSGPAITEVVKRENGDNQNVIYHAVYPDYSLEVTDDMTKSEIAYCPNEKRVYRFDNIPVIDRYADYDLVHNKDIDLESYVDTSINYNVTIDGKNIILHDNNSWFIYFGKSKKSVRLLMAYSIKYKLLSEGYKIKIVERDKDNKYNGNNSKDNG